MSVKEKIKELWGKVRDKAIGVWKETVAIAERHMVSLIMLGVTILLTAFFPLFGAESKAHLFYWLVALFMVRGVYWEETYLREIYKLQEELAVKK